MAHLIGTVSLSKSVYSLFDIAKFEHISQDRITFLMQACLKRIQNTAPDKSASGIQAFYNSIGATDNTINTFITHSKLRPFAGAIRLAMEKSYRNKQEAYFAMFYVSKETYHKWKKKGIEYNSSVVPEMSETGLNSKAVPMRTVKLPKMPMLKQFEAVMKNFDIKLSEGILLAIEEYMTRHKDVFGDIAREEYNENLVRENKMSLIHAYISPDTTNAVYKAIQRYNMQNFPHIKFSDFVDSALCEKLDRTSVQYTDPQLYNELMELKQVENDYLNGVSSNE